MNAASLAHLRVMCLALPETTEAGAKTDPTFSVRGQTFATGHCVGERESVWFKASSHTRRRLLNGPQRQFFTPPYVGQHGWMGAWLDDHCDWSEIDELLRDAYRMTAPVPLQDKLPPRKEDGHELVAVSPRLTVGVDQTHRLSSGFGVVPQRATHR